MSKLFDHSEHSELLQQAQRELEALGKNKLAGAVGRALALHFDMVGRVAQAENAVRDVRRASGTLEQIARDLEKYVASPNMPWIEPDTKFR